MLYCRLPKIGCTSWKRVIAYLSGNLSVSSVLQASRQTVHTEYHHAYVRELSHDMYTSIDVAYRIAAYFKFVFVRHPLERLLSAYVDKIQNRSTLEEGKFEQFDYVSYIIKICRNNIGSRNSEEIEPQVTFHEFLCYVSKAPADKLNRHWQPYWMTCNFCEPRWKYDYIGEYETIAEEANLLLDRWGVSELRFPKKPYSSLEQLNRFRKAFSVIPEHVIEAVWSRYRLDYDLFGYRKYPEFWYNAGMV